MTAAAPPVVDANPFVGPRSFGRDEKLYGRDREIRELLDLLVADRIVLCYSPSGAGKTSLIQAGLAPRLEEEGFHVLPPVRLNHEPQDGSGNRYAASAAACLAAPSDHGGASLRDRLAGVPVDEGRTGLLMFDQFEEVLSLDPTDSDAKRAFFVQLGEVLRDRRWWALFAMREDFLAALDPYLPLLPTRLATRFRLDLLSRGAAREVVTRTAASAGRTFAEEASTALVTELSRMVDGRVGPYVEPVQLQVVCRRLWGRLPPDATEITTGNMGDIGDVDGALGAYYAQEVARAAAGTGVEERTIRQWFERSLITELRFRGQAQAGPGDDDRAVRLLQDAHLVRAESRRGSTWYELAHDRLVAPVLADNQAWAEQHLTVFQRQAALWDERGRRDELLVADEILQDGEALAAGPGVPLNAAERAFLEACRKARAAAERERRSARRTRQLLAAASVGLVVALVAGVVAFASYRGARRDRNRAEAGERLRLAAPAIDMMHADPNLSVHLALQALEKSDAVEDAAGLDAQEVLLRRAVDSGRIGMTFPAEGVRRIAFSPDGQRLATLGDDGLAIWGARRWQEPATRPHDELVDLAFSPDGLHLVAAGGPDGAVKWSAGVDGFETFGEPSAGGSGPKSRNVAAVAFSGGQRRLLLASGLRSGVRVEAWEWPDPAPVGAATVAGMARAVAFSPDASTLATAGDDGVVRLWRIGPDVVDGRPDQPVPTTELGALQGHAGPVDDIAFSPDGAHLVTGGEDGTVRVWGVGSDEPGRVVGVGEDGVKAVTFSADGRWVAAGDGAGAALVIDAATGRDRFVAEARTGPVTDLAFDPSGDRLAVATEEGAPAVWDVGEKEAAGHKDTVYGVAFSADGQRLATASADWTAAVWDLAGNELAVLNGHEGEVNAVRFLPGGLAVTASDDRTARLWSVAPAREERTLSGHEDSVYDVAVSRDGTRLATAGQDGTARIWDVATGAEVRSPLDARDPLSGVAFSPDGRLLATAGQQGVRLWDLTTGRTVTSLSAGELEGGALRAAFSPDGAQLAASFEDGTAVWDVATAEPTRTFADPSWAFLSEVAFSPDGRRLVTADGTVRDVATGAAVAELPATHGVAFHPSGTMIATAGVGTTATVHDVATGRALRSLGTERGPAGSVTAVSTDVGRRRVLTGHDDGTATLWDASGRVLRTFPGGEGPVADVDLSADGRRLVAAFDDGSAVAWDVESGEELGSFALPADRDGPTGVGGGFVGGPEGIETGPDVDVAGGRSRARFVDDGTVLVAAASEGAWLWRPGRGSEPRRVGDPTWVVVGASDDGRWLAVARGTTVEIVDVRSARPRSTFAGEQPAAGAAISADGRRIVVVDDEGRALVGDARSGRRTLRPLGGGAARASDELVEHVAIDPEGTSVAVAGGGRLAVWDVRADEVTFRVEGLDVAGAVAFTAGGHLATIGDEGPLLHPVWLEELKATAASLAARPLSEAECRRYLQEPAPCTPERPAGTDGGRRG
ncbi:MAG: hypothetical protein ACRD03_04135 [Acidimicrobiales bacterium]